MQEWLLRQYRTQGDRYVSLCLWIATGFVLIVTPPISTSVLSRYDGLSFHQWLVSLAAAEGPLILAVLTAWLISRRQIDIVRRWASGDRAGLTPREVATEARQLPRRMFIAVAGIAFVIGGPVGAVTTLHQVNHIHVRDMLLLSGAGTLYASWAVVCLLIWAELAIRPILYETTQADPTLSGEGAFHYPMRMLVAAVIAPAILIGALYSGALIARSSATFHDLSLLVIYGLVIAGLFGIILVPLCVTLFVQPMRDLTAASRRVGAGDLDARVGVTSGDEFGQLSLAFNNMVEGLKDRDRLRVSNSLLVADLTESRRRLVATADRARRQVEADVHDGAQQQLALVRLNISMLRRRIAKGEDVETALEQLSVSVSRAINDVTELAQGIYPERLSSNGIPGALEDTLALMQHEHELITTGIGRYRPELEAAVYFTCGEALQNITKHAGENAKISVRLHEQDNVLTFVVADTGAGFAAERAQSSGLQNMLDRVASFGGELKIESAPGAGTTLIGRVPLR